MSAIKKVNSPILKRLIKIVLAALLLFYVGYQIYSANYSQIRTETAVYATMTDVVQTTGVVIRKETLISQPVSGVVAYTMEAGGKVAASGKVADIYQSTQAAVAQQQIERLDEEIDRLTQLSRPGDTYAANPDLLNTQISQAMVSLLDAAHSGDYTAVTEHQKDVLYLINEKQIVTGETTDFSSKIASLQAQRDSLAASSPAKTGEVTSPVSGYFIPRADGLESRFSYEEAETLTVEQIRGRRVTPEEIPAGTIGKVCENFDWYIACIVDAEDAIKFNEMKNAGQSVMIAMPFVSEESIPAEIAAVNQGDQMEEAAIIFRCAYMDEALAMKRCRSRSGNIRGSG